MSKRVRSVSSSKSTSSTTPSPLALDTVSMSLKDVMATLQRNHDEKVLMQLMTSTRLEDSTKKRGKKSKTFGFNAKSKLLDVVKAMAKNDLVDNGSLLRRFNLYTNDEAVVTARNAKLRFYLNKAISELVRNTDESITVAQLLQMAVQNIVTNHGVLQKIEQVHIEDVESLPDAARRSERAHKAPEPIYRPGEPSASRKVKKAQRPWQQPAAAAAAATVSDAQVDKRLKYLVTQVYLDPAYWMDKVPQQQHDALYKSPSQQKTQLTSDMRSNILFPVMLHTSQKQRDMYLSAWAEIMRSYNMYTAPQVVVQVKADMAGSPTTLPNTVAFLKKMQRRVNFKGKGFFHELLPASMPAPMYQRSRSASSSPSPYRSQQAREHDNVDLDELLLANMASLRT